MNITCPCEFLVHCVIYSFAACMQFDTCFGKGGKIPRDSCDIWFTRSDREEAAELMVGPDIFRFVNSQSHRVVVPS
jgi:hypothetical protein